MPFVIDDILIALGIAAASGAAGAAGNAIGSSNAANAQEDAANRALEFQKQMAAQQQSNYNQQREDQAPWLQAGQSSLGELLRQMQGGQFETPYFKFDGGSLASDPGYQFRMQQGQQALERSASARGFLNSGGALKSLARYSQGLASDEYGNAFNRHQAEYATRAGADMGRFNRLSAMAGTGQASAQHLGGLMAQQNSQLGQNGQTYASLQGAIGNAQAAGHMGAANSWGNFANSLGGAGMYAAMQGGQQQIPTQGAPYYAANPQQVPNQQPAWGYGSPSYWNPYGD